MVACGLLSRDVPAGRPPAGDRRHHADRQGADRRSSTSAPTSTPGRGTCTSTGSWAASTPSTSWARTPDGRPDERRRGGGQGERPDRRRLRPVPQGRAARSGSSATSRAATSTAGRPTWSSDDGFVGNVVLKAGEGRLRVHHEDGGQGSRDGRCRTDRGGGDEGDCQAPDRPGTTTAVRRRPAAGHATASASSATARSKDVAINNALGVAAKNGRVTTQREDRRTSLTAMPQLATDEGLKGDGCIPFDPIRRHPVDSMPRPPSSSPARVPVRRHGRARSPSRCPPPGACSTGPRPSSASTCSASAPTGRPSGSSHRRQPAGHLRRQPRGAGSAASRPSRTRPTTWSPPPA